MLSPPKDGSPTEKHEFRNLKPVSYLKEPDYSLPLYELSAHMRERMQFKFELLYGRERAPSCMKELERRMKVFYAHKPQKLREWEEAFVPEERFSEKDVILITYGDLIQSAVRSPLETLAHLTTQYLVGTINTVHILPFFPYSSDRGFSVMEFESVNPELGTWEDIENLGKTFRLMFDGVINHASSKSRWFQEFLNGHPYYSDFFIKFSTKEAIPDHLLALVLRPRTSDLLTPYQSIDGEKYVWTTFSPDQIDLNYQSEHVLLEMIDILLFYVRKGADLIRLDAITYLWEEIGTTCVHLYQTHTIVQLFRDVLDCMAPYVALVTETNVPHRENIEYFGNGKNEAQLVYNFSLPPLVLHTFHTGDCTRLHEWAATLESVSSTATYLNFLDSHDGIGVMPVEDLLPKQAVGEMCWKVMEHGGFVSYRTDGEGNERPYELNSTWFSALNDPNAGESLSLQVDRFMASRSIALALRGVPAIYLHGLLGSRNDMQNILITRSLRSVNRHNIDEEELLKELDDPESPASRISQRMVELIKTRIGCKAFHPNGDQELVDISKSLFSLIRISPDGTEQVLCLTSVSAAAQQITLTQEVLRDEVKAWKDLISDQVFVTDSSALRFTMKPYEIRWLTPLREPSR